MELKKITGLVEMARRSQMFSVGRINYIVMDGMKSDYKRMNIEGESVGEINPLGKIERNDLNDAILKGNITADEFEQLVVKAQTTKRNKRSDNDRIGKLAELNVVKRLKEGEVNITMQLKKALGEPVDVERVEHIGGRGARDISVNGVYFDVKHSSSIAKIKDELNDAAPQHNVVGISRVKDGYSVYKKWVNSNEFKGIVKFFGIDPSGDTEQELIKDASIQSNKNYRTNTLDSIVAKVKENYDDKDVKDDEYTSFLKEKGNGWLTSIKKDGKIVELATICAKAAYEKYFGKNKVVKGFIFVEDEGLGNVKYFEVPRIEAREDKNYTAYVKQNPKGKGLVYTVDTDSITYEVLVRWQNRIGVRNITASTRKIYIK